MSYQPARAPWQEKLAVRGLEYGLTWWGERTDAPLVLLHGYMDCGATWQFLVDCLPHDWSLVAPDWRGFGASGWAPGGYWFPDYLADLEQLLRVLVPRAPARIVGHSMGANIAALYAGIRPARLRWLVSLEGIGLPATQPENAPSRYARWLDQLQSAPAQRRYRSVQQLAVALRQRNPAVPAERAQYMARALSRSAVEGSPEERVLAADPRHRLINPVLYRIEEAQACWSRVEIPVLLLVGGGGESGRRIDDATDAVLRNSFRRLRVVTLPAAGHMMHQEDPSAVSAHVVEFAAAHP